MPLQPDGRDAPLSTPDSSRESRDRAWVESIRTGDVPAFERLFRTYYDRLCRSVAAYVGDRDATEDVVQAVFARIWEDRAHWMARDLEHYLFAAVRRRAISVLRHASVSLRTAPLLALDHAARAGVGGADEEFEAWELRRRLERAIAALPPRTREAFVLSRSEGLSYDEVALRMRISPKTVGVHVSRALAALRRVLPGIVAVGVAITRK